MRTWDFKGHLLHLSASRQSSPKLWKTEVSFPLIFLFKVRQRRRVPNICWSTTLALNNLMVRKLILTFNLNSPCWLFPLPFRDSVEWENSCSPFFLCSTCPQMKTATMLPFILSSGSRVAIHLRVLLFFIGSVCKLILNLFHISHVILELR